MTDFTREQKRAEALREVAMRKRVYSFRVSQDKMSQADAERQIAIMETIATDYAEPDLFGKE